MRFGPSAQQKAALLGYAEIIHRSHGFVSSVEAMWSHGLIDELVFLDLTWTKLDFLVHNP